MKYISRLERSARCFNLDMVMRSTAGPGGLNQQLFQLSSNGGINVGSAGVQAIHTTTPGKTFYITDIQFTTEVASAAANLVQLQISGGVIIFEAYVGNTSPVDFPGIESQPQSPSNSILSIKWGAFGSGHLSYFISGYEQ